MTRHFLLKINAENCPNGVGVPSNSAEWENGDFQVKSPRRSRFGQAMSRSLTAFPVRGDRILVWVSETEGGSGLTAQATVDLSSAAEKTLRVSDVHLMAAPRLSNSDLPDRPYIRVDAREALHPFSLDERDDILNRAQAKSKSAQIKGIDETTTRQAPTSIELAEWRAERQKSLQLVEIRANQGAFRDALLRRYKKCAITGWHVQAVLEAAHLIPYASGHPERDSIENGILLRADIHTLMDRYLLAIEPDSLKVVLAPELLGTGYRKYHGRKVDLGADQFNLKCSFKLFESARSR